MGSWRSVVTRLREQVDRHPDMLAVEAGGARYSYRDFGARIDRLAAVLCMRLHGAEPVVGVCLDRTVDLPAWLFAIHSCGGAYCPVDPATPSARMAHLLEDARLSLIVTSRRHAHLFAGSELPVLVADDAVADGLPTPLPARIAPDSLAYVIFTSGSTGRPKGVEIGHGSLVALLDNMASAPGLRPGERMLGLTRIGFDLSVPDLFLPFFVGGALVLIDLDVAADPLRLGAAIDEHRPDLVQATPSTWNLLVETGWQGRSDLTIVTGGEVLTPSLAVRLRRECGALWNIYGPTEATVWATAQHVDRVDGEVPVGRPMPGVVVTVIDQQGCEASPGQMGEIRIGGIGLARGYRNRPELTEERFHLSNDGSRWYATGDLGTIDPAGVLYYVGRNDDQIKFRGFRIELGDIEAALARHSAVAEAAAKVFCDGGGEGLAGYVVARKGTSLDAAALRTFLRDQLPAYMVPDRLHVLPVMPLTINGKIDRAALPVDTARLPATALHAEPSHIAGPLAAIWSDLIGIDRIAPTDDFFELGGYSLMTVRLSRRIEDRFGVKLSISDLFRHPTLGAMAKRIGLGTSSSAASLFPIHGEGGHRTPLIWLDAGPVVTRVLRLMPADQPVWALNLDEIDQSVLGDAALTVEDTAEGLKAKLLGHFGGPFFVGGWCRWGLVAYELARQLRDDGHEVPLLVMLDAECPRRRTGIDVLWDCFRRARHGPRALPTNGQTISEIVLEAGRSFVPKPYDGDVLLVRPQGQDAAGWRRKISGVLRKVHVGANHVDMVLPPNSAELARLVDFAMREREIVAKSEDTVRPMSQVGAGGL